MERTSLRAEFQRRRSRPSSLIVARWRLVVATFLLHGCTSTSPALDLVGPGTIRNDGTAARYQAVATTNSGAPGEGVVVVTSTAGTVQERLVLSDGVVSFELGRRRLRTRAAYSRATRVTPPNCRCTSNHETSSDCPSRSTD
jgi:hypothetical protein